MTTIRVNRATCQGHANCAMALPAVFALDDEGLVTLSRPTAPDDDLPALRRAAYDCPTDSITLTE